MYLDLVNLRHSEDVIVPYAAWVMMREIKPLIKLQLDELEAASSRINALFEQTIEAVHSKLKTVAAQGAPAARAIGVTKTFYQDEVDTRCQGNDKIVLLDLIVLYKEFVLRKISAKIMK